jgi:hypothetical protein
MTSDISLLNRPLQSPITIGDSVPYRFAQSGASGFKMQTIFADSLPPELASGAVPNSMASNGASGVHMYPDGSLRTPDGKFASIAGMPAPGTSAALDFAKVLADSGIDVVGTELEVDGPLGVRRYDIGTRNPDGTIFGLEIKTGGAIRNSYQDFSDMYINQFGAVGRGRIAGQMITGSMTIYLPPGGW